MPRGQAAKVALAPAPQESTAAIKWLIVVVSIGTIVGEVYFGIPALGGKKDLWLWFGVVHILSAVAAFFLFRKQFRREMEEIASVLVVIFVSLIGGGFSFFVAAALSDGRFQKLSGSESKKDK